MRRYLLPVLLAAASLLSARSARAQFEAYVTFAPTHISNVVNGSTAGLNSQFTYGGYWSEGVGGGVTVNFLPLPVVSLGLDLRGSTRPGTNGADTAMAGLKLGAKVPFVHIKPYIEAAGGYVGTRTAITTGIGTTAGGTDTQKWAGYEILGGVDTKLVGPLDVRIIEVGAGTATLVSGPNDNVRNITVVTINTGLVVHF